MTARQVFAVGAVAGLVMWPATALAILVALHVESAKRRAAYKAATDANRRDYDEFARLNPQVDPS
jgi:hypothetical protein